MAHITAWSMNRLKKVHISIDRGRRNSDSDSEGRGGICTPHAVRKHGRRFRWLWLFIVVPLATLLLITFLTREGTHNAYIFLGVFVTVAIILLLVCLPLAISTGYKQAPIVEYHMSARKSMSQDPTAVSGNVSPNSADSGAACPALAPPSPIGVRESSKSFDTKHPVEPQADDLVVDENCEAAVCLQFPTETISKDALKMSLVTVGISSDSGRDSTDKSPLRF